MQDKFLREINYLRISITDRCNLRCLYCMPEEGVQLTACEDILRFEEFLKIVEGAVKVGIKKIRLTGGEPLVRLGLIDFIKELNRIPEIDDIALTTNGILLPKYAKSLKEAGLNRVNISLDTLNPERFKKITRVGNIKDVWAGIKSAFEVGLNPVKINTVVIKGQNDDELLEFANLTKEYPLHIRFIELMPIGTSDGRLQEGHLSINDMKKAIEPAGELVPIKKIEGNGPAKYYQIQGAEGTIGFISAISEHFCGNCNRLRLTSEGQLRPCLHGSKEIDLRGPLRRGATTEEIAQLIKQGISIKPDRHTMVDTGWNDNKRIMSQIGG